MRASFPPSPQVKAGQKKQEAEKNEADAWKDGAKVRTHAPSAPTHLQLICFSSPPPFSVQVKDTSKEEKRQAELARKAELARLLAEVRTLLCGSR